jgi:mannose-1-phosphate guanylyltransferase/mannose-6-phosphate isomerase
MADNSVPVYAVLLAGGVGTRLWPVSRERHPKQLAKFIGNDSLIQTTVKRLLPVIPADAIKIVCGNEHVDDISRHLDEIGISPAHKIIAEPCGRNTAPAILLAVLSIMKAEKDAIVCVFPADHVIGDEESFYERLRSAIQLAESGHIVTFGITPSYPETGYGYIEGGAPLPAGAQKTKRFVEKPDLETAQRYIQAGNFFWNSGMFAFRMSVIYKEFEQFQPDLLDRMKRLNPSDDKNRDRGYNELPNISIDYAIMEHTHRSAVLPSNFGWSDIGSWKSLYDFLPKNADANVIGGDVMAHETRNCFIKGHDRLIATNRLENLVVVETSDAVFVSDLESSRDVKHIVAQLKNLDRKEHREYQTLIYHWGSDTALDNRNGYCVNRLIISPGSVCAVSISFASHRQWTGVSGKGCIDVGSVSENIMSGVTVSAASGDVVTITNQSDRPLVVIQLFCDES